MSISPLLLAALISAGLQVDYRDPVSVADSCMLITTVDPGMLGTTVEVRGAITGERETQGLAPGWWGLTWGEDYAARLRMGNEDFGSPADRRFVTLTIFKGDSIISDQSFHDHFNTSPGGYNTLILNVDSHGTATISGGTKTMKPLWRGECSAMSSQSQVNLYCHGTLTAPVIAIEHRPDPAAALQSGMTIEAIDRIISSNRADPLVGYWDYLDRETDPSRARAGGRYSLAVVPDDSSQGSYLIIYLSGAETNASAWLPGMIKGTLSPTVFVDTYDLRWADATMEVIDRDLNARMEQNSILALEFPLLKAQMRFFKRQLRDK